MFFITFSQFLVTERPGACKYRGTYFCPAVVLYRKSPMSAPQQRRQQVTRDHSQLHHDLSWNLPWYLAFFFLMNNICHLLQQIFWLLGSTEALSSAIELYGTSCHRKGHAAQASVNEGFVFSLTMQQCVRDWEKQLCLPKTIESDLFCGSSGLSPKPTS